MVTTGYGTVSRGCANKSASYANRLYWSLYNGPAIVSPAACWRDNFTEGLIIAGGLRSGKIINSSRIRGCFVSCMLLMGPDLGLTNDLWLASTELMNFLSVSTTMLHARPTCIYVMGENCFDITDRVTHQVLSYSWQVQTSFLQGFSKSSLDEIIVFKVDL